VLVDERPEAAQDVLWSGEHLYVVTAGSRASAGDAARVLRYTYDPAAERFDLDPNFPVTINGTGTPAAVMAIDGTGTAWVTYTAGGQVWLVHSLEDDARWSAPFPLILPGAIVDDDGIASIVAYGPGRVGVMWSNQLADSVSFASHVDGDPPGAWSEPETVIDGTGSSDDHISLQAYPTDEGTGVVAALRTSLDTGDSVNGLDPLILLAVRADDGTWTTHMVSQVRDRQARAVVMADPAARMFYVAATSPSRGGAITYKRTPMDEIRFETGVGTVLMASPDDPRLKDAVTTKQPLSVDAGMVVLASDRETARYVHAVVDLGAGLPAADPADPARLAAPEPPDPAIPVTLLHNDFEPWPVGPADGTGWTVREGDPAGALTIADDGDTGRALRVKPADGGTPVRACRDLSAIPGGRLQVDLRVRVSAIGTSDTSLIQLRGSGGEVGGVRLSSVGDLAWFDGATKARSETASFVLGQWYRVAVTVDQATRTYDFVVKTDGGDDVLRLDDLAWRSPDVTGVRTICIESTSGTAGQDLDLSDVTVTLVPAP
jgi:hypothetical protein